MKSATTILSFCVAALLALGMVILFSAKMLHEAERWRPVTQLVWCCLGLVGCIIASAIDYRLLKKVAPYLYVISVLLLIAVFFFKGIGGARRWVKIGGFQFQPSELAKISLIICLAYYSEFFQRQMNTFKRGVLLPAIFSGVILGLIFLEPDVGNTMLLALVCSMMLLLAGLRWRYFLPPVLIGLTALSLFIWKDPMRSKRIHSWLNVEETKQGIGLQAYQAKVALGSGGLTGLGLGNGRQKLGFIPEHHTDFIFSIIGEELGLVATMGVLIAFVGIILSGMSIAYRAPDFFGMLLASGITCMIGVQAFINIGVVTGVLPNKGISLPFISFGGSNLMMMLCSVGLLVSVARRGVEPEQVVVKNNPFAEIPTGQEA